MRRLVLVGGGHAHLHVLGDLASRPLSGADVTLVTPTAWHHYSGMVPGFLQGVYAEADLTIDLASLAARAGVRVVEAMAERIDLNGLTVDAGGARVPFDILSLDVGATPAGLDVPGVREHAVTVRPMRQAVALRARIDALATPARRGPARVTVVGAGAGASRWRWPSIGASGTLARGRRSPSSKRRQKSCRTTRRPRGGARRTSSLGAASLSRWAAR